MTPTGDERPALLVVDSSALVALLADSGPAGSWVGTQIAGATLAAPALAVFEVANVLRRQVAFGRLDETQGTLAHADLLALALQLWPYSLLAERAWQLRHNLTVYDACYVALAELLVAPLITLDVRTVRSAGPHCPIVTFPSPAS
ncbi:MAG: type II toxin-antitoxin system VapC family toxin [Acidimicrobiales bacterium]